jgi:hypothetical protein
MRGEKRRWAALTDLDPALCSTLGTTGLIGWGRLGRCRQSEAQEWKLAAGS